MRIIGIDPGLRCTGYGVIEASGGRLRYLSAGTVSTSSGDIAPRLRRILDGLREVLAEYQPDQASIEIVFSNVNPQSTLALGQARGAAICAVVLAGLPVAEYTALQVKQATVGNGHAAKEQVQEMTRRLLGLSEAPRPDAADALACALCHAHSREGARRLELGARFKMRRGRLVAL